MLDHVQGASLSEVIGLSSGVGGTVFGLSAAARSAGGIGFEGVSAFVGSGLHRVMQPVEHGGWDLGLDVHVASALELGRGDAGQAWVLVSYGDNAHIVSAFGVAAQDDVWGQDQDALVASSLKVGGELVVADGGYRVTGQWAGAAGIDHAGWVLASGTVGAGEERRVVFFLVPKADVRVIDDWDVAGLSGAGAKSFAVDGVFVPAHRVLEQPGALIGRSSLALSAVALGGASAMLEVFVGQCLDTLRRGRRVADNFATGLRLSESKADIDAGILSVTQAASETMALVRDGKGLDAERRALNKLKAGYGAMVAARAADRIFAAAGAKAILLVNPIQACLLDIHALAAQDVFAWDACASDYGQLRLTPPAA